MLPLWKDSAGIPSSRAGLAYLQSLKLGEIRVFMAIGAADPVLSEVVMRGNVLQAFKDSTGALVMRIPHADHYVQEWSESDKVAESAIRTWAFGSDEEVNQEGLEHFVPK